MDAWNDIDSQRALKHGWRINPDGRLILTDFPDYECHATLFGMVQEEAAKGDDFHQRALVEVLLKRLIK